MSTLQVIIKKKVNGEVFTILPLTQSNLVKVDDENTLDIELRNIKYSISKSVPIGSVVIWFGDQYPDGWLPLNGQSISRTNYSELFTIYGIKYGSDDSTTFKLPNQSIGNETYNEYNYIVKAKNINTVNSGLSTLSLEDESANSLLSVPIGTILDFASDDIPNGYMLANGTSLLINDYPELYSIIGYRFSSAQDGVHFNLPNIEDTNDDIVKIIKVSGSTYINDSSNSPENVSSSQLIQNLMNRISALEDALGI